MTELVVVLSAEEAGIYPACGGCRLRYRDLYMRGAPVADRDILSAVWEARAVDQRTLAATRGVSPRTIRNRIQPLLGKGVDVPGSGPIVVYVTMFAPPDRVRVLRLHDVLGR